MSPKYYQEIIDAWSKQLLPTIKLTTAILSQFFWFSNEILIDKKHFHLKYFCKNNIKFLKQFLNVTRHFKSREVYEKKYNLEKTANLNRYNLYMQYLLRGRTILCMEKKLF